MSKRKVFDMGRNLPSLSDFTFTLNAAPPTDLDRLMTEQMERQLRLRMDAGHYVTLNGTENGGGNYTITVSPNTADPPSGATWQIQPETIWGYPPEMVQPWVADPPQVLPWVAPRTPDTADPLVRENDERRRRTWQERVRQNIAEEVPEGLEILKARIETYPEGTRFIIKAPDNLPPQIPPEVYARLDFELKMALIRAFRMVPKDPKRMLITEDEDDGNQGT